MKRLMVIAVSALVTMAGVATLQGTGTLLAQEKGSGAGSGSGSGTGAGHNMKAKAGKGSGAGVAIKGDTGPSSRAFSDASMAMHKDMDITYTGDADVDFAHGA